MKERITLEIGGVIDDDWEAFKEFFIEHNLTPAQSQLMCAIAIGCASTRHREACIELIRAVASIQYGYNFGVPSNRGIDEEEASAP